MTLTASAANASGFHPLRRNALLQTLQAEIDRGRLPGAVVVLARHGQVNCFESLGVQNPATGEAIKIKASKKLAFRAAKEVKDAI